MINSGLNISWNTEHLTFHYGNDVFGPPVEKRSLNEIRKSLSNPYADGPEYVYSVAMDVGKITDRLDLQNRNLLFGAMIFQKGQIGDEPVRSQGHVHAVSPSCNASTAEVYEIWSGKAIIYMQEFAEDDPGRCYAVYANPGDVVIVPPGWAHGTINAGIHKPMIFGAWCVRDYGFDYSGVRSHGGLAYFPIVKQEQITWKKNPTYFDSTLIVKEARDYRDFGITKGVPIYRQYEKNRDLFTFVTNPETVKLLWQFYTP